MTPRWARTVGAGVVMTLAAFHTPPAWAQAWTPAQGEGAVSIQFQDTFVKYHSLPTVRVDRGHIFGDSALADVSYGITDRFAVSFGVPYVESKYSGERPHQKPIDGGAYHGAVQDLRFDARYNVTRRGIVFTPFLGTMLPSHSYEYFAHSAIGRRLRELRVGAYSAALLTRVTPGLFVQSSYSYGFVEKVLGISHNRSNLDAELGYFVRPEFRVFALAAGQLTHGGVELSLDSPTLLGPILYPHHDQITHDNLLNIGGGAAFDLTPSVGVYGSIIHTAAGRNVHMLQRGITFGMSWSFSRGDRQPRATRTAWTAADTRRRTLGRCICQKTK
jgi:hypothetical protein